MNRSYQVRWSVVSSSNLTLWACGFSEEPSARFFKLVLHNLGEAVLQIGDTPEEVLQAYIDMITPYADADSYEYVWILSEAQRLLEWWKEIEGEWSWN